MKLKYYTCILFLFFASYPQARGLTVKVVFNNTADMVRQKDLIDELKNSVNGDEIQKALDVNENITDKNLKFDIVFFDRNHVGNMKLKRAHVLTVDGYREKWKASVEIGSAVLFLFVKEYGKNEYEFNGLSPSKQLENEHLFEKVVEFINENLKGEHKTILTNGSKYLARAMTPVWTDTKKTDAENLVKQKKYKADHINYFHNSWKSTFLDIKPIANTEGKLLKVWLITTDDTLKTTSVYADTTVFKGNNITFEGEGYSFSFLGITITLFCPNPERILLLQPKNKGIESQSYIVSLVKALQESKKYSISKKVSEWKWKKVSANGPFSLVSTDDLTDIKDNDKFELIKVNLHDTYPEGSEIPVIHPWHPRTFCNVYASDLARDILFSRLFTSKNANSSEYAPWGAHQSAARLHDEIGNNKNGHFKAVTFDEAWQYTNKGYVVYLTAYNWRYYANKANDPYSYSGHISTCYQTGNYTTHEGARLIQVGGSGTEGVVEFVTKVWTKNNYTVTDDESSHVKAHVYLGYIIK